MRPRRFLPVYDGAKGVNEPQKGVKGAERAVLFVGYVRSVVPLVPVAGDFMAELDHGEVDLDRRFCAGGA